MGDYNFLIFTIRILCLTNLFNMSMLSKPTRRGGYGRCQLCKSEFLTRYKRKYCSCGEYLGGSYEKGPNRAKNDSVPKSVKIYEHLLTNGSKHVICSAQTSDRDTRQFIVDGGDRTRRYCYQRQCQKKRATCLISGAVEELTCDHLDAPQVGLIYSGCFTNEDIQNFTPNDNIQEALKKVQEEGWPTVVKVSKKNYAVKGEASASNPVGYAHVMCSNAGKYLS